jgi:hypothetical protein
MSETLSKDIEELRNAMYPNGEYKKTINSLSIKKRFPLIYEKVKGPSYKENLYMLLFDIEERPTCKNPLCDNRVNLRNFKKGFSNYCSNSCIGQHQKIDKEFSNKIKTTKRENHKELWSQRYPNLDIKTVPNYYIISDYCHHGEFKLYRSTLHKLYRKDLILCPKCRDEFIQTYVPTEKDIAELRNKFEEFYNENRFKLKEEWLKRYYYREYKIILLWSQHIKYASLMERIYLFRHSLKERPLCHNCKERHTHFNVTTNTYTTFCDSYSCLRSTSSEQIELTEWLKDILGKDEVQTDFTIDNRKFDTYIKRNNLVIEYNGLYWHSDAVHDDKNYHVKKVDLLEENGIRHFAVWEDDWEDKRDIVRSMILNALNITEHKIHARKCTIREVSYNDSVSFLNNNHLQGSCPSKHRYGLYFENELVSLMTLGNNRKVLGKDKKEGEYELLRFCNKKNISVIGGASKLFKHFIKENDPDSVISYAARSHSGGNLYDALGFTFVKKTLPGFCWVKRNKRYNRSNFMKHKLVEMGHDKNKTADEIMREQGYNKLWDYGNLLYQWKR